jgi:hypothetical protein
MLRFAFDLVDQIKRKTLWMDLCRRTQRMHDIPDLRAPSRKGMMNCGWRRNKGWLTPLARNTK